MRLLSYFFAICALFFTLSCCPCRKSADLTKRELSSTSWKLLQLNGHAVTSQGEEYTLVFNDKGEVAGMGKCNRIMGSYAYDINSRTLKFDHVGMTRMMCHEPDREDEYGAMLGNVTHYEIDGQTLVLLNGGESVALFKKLVPDTAQK